MAKFSAAALRVVSFDATNTIIGMREPISAVYSRVASEFGFAVDPSQIASAFPLYMSKLSKSHPCFGFNTIGHVEWWRRIVQGCLQEASAQSIPQQKSDEIAQRLFNFYGSAIPWCIVDTELKRVVKDLRQRGLGVAVVSNFDGRLTKVLQELEVYPMFDIVLASGELGIEKPDPRVFQLVADHFGIRPSELLHIGDTVKKDYKGATDFGANAVLFDPSSTNCDVPSIHRITSFSQLLVE